MVHQGACGGGAKGGETRVSTIPFGRRTGGSPDPSSVRARIALACGAHSYLRLPEVELWTSRLKRAAFRLQPGHLHFVLEGTGSLSNHTWKIKSRTPPSSGQPQAPRDRRRALRRAPGKWRFGSWARARVCLCTCVCARVWMYVCTPACGGRCGRLGVAGTKATPLLMVARHLSVRISCSIPLFKQK